MTLQELNHVLSLKEKLESNKEMLQSLQEAVYPGAQKLTGMPHMSGVRDKVGDLAAEIADMKDCIAKLEEDITRAETPIIEFIKNIKDDRIRTIFRLRFIRGLSWGEVAAIAGKYRTEDSVKNVCYRYIAELQRDDV